MHNSSPIVSVIAMRSNAVPGGTIVDQRGDVTDSDKEHGDAPYCIHGECSIALVHLWLGLCSPDAAKPVSVSSHQGQAPHIPCTAQFSSLAGPYLLNAAWRHERER